MKKAAIATQCGWRVRVARRELRNLKMAAKEAGALQDAKSKLENQLEELTSNLELEKQMRVHITSWRSRKQNLKKSKHYKETQETKSAEISRLQSALQDMQLEIEELSKGLEMSNDLSAENEQLKVSPSSLQNKNDGDVSKLSEEQIKQEVPVIDQTAIIKLEAENQQLKELVSSLEEKIDALDRKHDETSSNITEQLKENVSSDYEIALVGSLEKNQDGNHSSEGQNEGKSMLKLDSLTEDGSTDNERVNKLAAQNKDLNERVSDMETEEHIRRKQALVNSTSRRMSPQVSFTGGASENGHHESLAPIPAKKTGTESSRIGQQPHEFVDVLLKCVSQNVGFSHGKPVAAITICKCLIHWKIFEADKTSIFDKIVPVFGSAIENQEDDNHLAYWLTNTSTLLFLLQRSLRHSPTGSSPTKPPQPTSFLGRMTQGFRSTSSPNLSTDVVHQVDARYPALLFKQQLTAYVETMYGIIRENFKREVSSLLSSCIQDLKKSSHDSSVVKSPSKSSEDNDSPSKTSEESSLKKSSEENLPAKSNSPKQLSEEDSLAKQGQAAMLSEENSPANSWQSIIGLLNYNLITWKKNYVPPFLVQKIFSQTFQYINVQLFNCLLLEQEYCTFNMGKEVKAGLDELDSWCSQATGEFVGSSWDELKPTRQAVVLLVTEQKSTITYDDLTTNLCPVLGTQQLYRICTLSNNEDHNDHNVSPEVISNLKLLMTNEDEDSRSFLLDDDSSIPFETDEIANCMQEKDFANVKSVSELADNPNFLFLMD
ncbi:hypothetical protein F2Q68_00038280 [Brassica cretica]|uniref:Dilute domain-containing protein n=1 Tax=Brassica cretica TaxID=69181 RepID=A0A8S9MIJ1_BRACR|nr:hypothetical protein F2Q68_00038280 [Brassica cretica]